MSKEDFITTLKQKIAAFSEELATPLLKALQKNDFNLLFRTACSNPTYYKIVVFLVINKTVFEIDLNARGLSSGKSGLDVACDYDTDLTDNKKTLLYLLQLKEIQVNDHTKEKLLKKYGHKLRQTHLMPTYGDLLNKLKTISQEITVFFENYKKLLKRIDEELNLHIKSQLPAIIASPLSDHSFNTITSQAKKVIAFYQNQLDIFKPKFTEFKTLLDQFTPCVNGINNLLFGYEITSTDSTPILYKCQENMDFLSKEMETIEYNYHYLEEQCKTVILYLLNALEMQAQTSLLTQKQTAHKHVKDNIKISTEGETKSNTEDITVYLKNDEETVSSHLNTPQHHVNIPPNDGDNAPKESTATQTIDIASSQDSENEDNGTLSALPNMTNLSFSPKKRSQKYSRISKQANTTAEIKSTVSEETLATIRELKEETAQLQCKGTIKFAEFDKILNNFSKLIDLNVIKRHGKKGAIVVTSNQGNFSFHQPHNGKGVDPNVPKQLITILEQAESEHTSRNTA